MLLGQSGKMEQNEKITSFYLATHLTGPDKAATDVLKGNVSFIDIFIQRY
jgi:hypothetical protein